MRVIYVLFLGLYVLLARVNAQAVKGWQELTISDGLSQGMVFELKQDGKGFIWIATKDGLNRYDGYNVKVFSHDPYNPFSLADNGCSALLIDSRQRLWVGTLNHGLDLFDTSSQRFYHINISDQVSPDANNYQVRTLVEDPDGNIWVGTDKDRTFKIKVPVDVGRKAPAEANITNLVQIQRFPFLNNQPIKRSFYVDFTKNGQLLIGTFYGLYRVNARQPGRATKLTGGFFPSRMASIFVDAVGEYAFWANKDNIEAWHKGVLKQINLPVTTNKSIKIVRLDPHILAVVTPDYLWLLPAAELFRQDSLRATDAFVTLPPNLYAISSVIRDRTGMIWIGTAGYGLRKFNPKIKPFQTYLPTVSLSNLYQDRKGQTYVRDQYGYSLLDKRTNQLKPFLPKTFWSTNQWELLQDQRGLFWLLLSKPPLNLLQLVKFTEDWQLLNVYPLPANTVLGLSGNHILEDKAGSFWMAAADGNLLHFNPATEVFQSFSYQHLLPKQGADIETNALHVDPGGNLWIGTQQGLIKAGHWQRKPTFSIYKNASSDRHTLSENFVLSIADDPHQPNRYLWVGTKGGGLERLDKQTGLFDHFTEKEGLPNKVVYGILVDEFKNLWLSTNRGIAQFNPRTGKFRKYTKVDGLQDDEFNTNSYFKTASGHLMFGGVNGLTVFRPSELQRASDIKPLANVIGLKINNQPVEVGGEDGILTAPIEQTERISLAHDQNLVTLEFGVMDYTNTAKNQYRYQLVGIDRDWVDAGTNRFANYAQLPPGSYILQAMGSADGNAWSDPVTLRIQIHPPFYRSWWAYLLYAVALLLTGQQLYLFQQQRMKLQQQIRLEQEETRRMAELDALKTQLFTNISHEFRTPLTLILGPVEQLVDEYRQDERFPMIQRNANRLLSLINQLLDLSKLDAGQLKPELEPGDIAVFLRMLASSFNSLAESRQIWFSFLQPEQTLVASFDRDKLEKIVTNLLSNAFKFTPAGKSIRMLVRYQLTSTVNKLIMEVRDTGIGIPADKLPHIFERFYQADSTINRAYEGTGIGLALVTELVKVLDGHMNVSSTPGVGTTFTVELPLTVADAPATSAPKIVSPPTKQLLPEAIPTALEQTDTLARSGSFSTTDEGLPTAKDNILLIIEDNADMRAYVRSIFETDYQVIEASDGQEGLEKATASLPNIIICDLMMPRLDGAGFCKALKAQFATSHIPVVMLTAKATVEDRIQGFSFGADDYLTKPFNQAEIQARVQNLIQQRTRLFQWFTTNFPSATTVATPGLLQTEHKFVEQLYAVVIEHVDDSAFSVELLAQEVNLSRSQLHRKLKALTNDTPTNFIREVRLNKAAELLAVGDQSVTQVAFAVGFESPSYFAKLFQERYGVVPSQFGKPTQSGE